MVIDGMQTSISKIGEEILKNNELTLQITGNLSTELEARRREIQKLQKEFGGILSFKP